MRMIRILLMVYCFAAVAGLAVWGWNSIEQTKVLDGQIEAASQRLDELDAVADQKLNALRELEAVQRSGRKDFSGPEAVDASLAVQDAQGELDAAERQVKLAGEELALIAEKQDRQSKLIVPLLAGVPLHLIIGISLIRSAPAKLR